MKAAAARLPGLEPISGKDWERQVLQLARTLGWRAAHFRAVLTKHGWTVPVAADGRGFPDFVFVRDRVIWVELKAGRGRLEPDQIAWRDALIAAGQEWHLWAPHDLETTVLQTLRRRTDR